ncbi:MAG TPA: aldo/keto reductase [Gammaproteobacteria bacterium]|nr:aldo/keto reductase [Gammaproteobacteria bacterium]
MINIQSLKLIYGTAWKGAKTTGLVKQAVAAGFFAIDTANQPKHYSESLVGEALLQLQATGVHRQQLFLQTKFTPVDGHDENIPYNPSEDYTTQVLTSFHSSLKHLHTDYLDSYLLHGPYVAVGLSDADWQVWQAIESLYDSGQAKLIGVSNVNIKQLELLTNHARIKPMVVQNRCFASYGWDKQVREFCCANDIIYQGFSLLTANLPVLESAAVSNLANHYNKTPAQVIFRFAQQLGILPLTGTTDLQHMREDLHLDNFTLTEEDKMMIGKLS